MTNMLCHTTKKWNFVNLTLKFMCLTKQVPNKSKVLESWQPQTLACQFAILFDLTTDLKLLVCSFASLILRLKKNQLSVQSLSHVQVFATPWTAIPGFPVQHQLLELAQTHALWVSDAIKPSHPLSSPSTPAFNFSQNQSPFHQVCFFASCSQSIGASASASVLPMHI